MTKEELKAYLELNAPAESIASLNFEVSQPQIFTSAENLLSLMNWLHKDENLFFDFLSCLSGVDFGVDKHMQVVYHLYSIPFAHFLVVKVNCDRNAPEVPSIATIWESANWHEREAYDLFGINFIGHPDLRRILLPSDWQGFPLRKDYKNEETYRGIKVDF